MPTALSGPCHENNAGCSHTCIDSLMESLICLCPIGMQLGTVYISDVNRIDQLNTNTRIINIFCEPIGCIVNRVYSSECVRPYR